MNTVSISTAEIPHSNPSVIVSESDNFTFPEYPPSQLLSSFKMEVSETVPGTSLERLPNDSFYYMIPYLDYKSAAKLSQTSKTLYNSVNVSIDWILKQVSIMQCEIRFNRKDHFIISLHLVQLFKESSRILLSV